MKIIRPDDFHVHFRFGELLKTVVPYTAAHFRRALVMPNVPAVENARQVTDYYQEIRNASDMYPHFKPLMTIKLTHRTMPSDIINAAKIAGVIAAKLYPQGATTGSHDGITDLDALWPVFEVMEKYGMVLCVHAECPDAFVMHREEIYIRYIPRIHIRFPRLRIVIEHISTACAVDWVRRMGDNVAATITAHHLFQTLDDVIGNGLRPHNFCYPIPKTKEDRTKLQAAAFGEYGKRFFFGSDSAPHLVGNKETACGCAGVFSAPALLPALATLFMRENDVEGLQSFMSERGAQFYGLPRNEDYIELVEEPMTVPDIVKGVVPWMSGTTFGWRVSTLQEES